MRIKSVLGGGCAVAALLHSLPSYAQTTYNVPGNQPPTTVNTQVTSGPVTVENTAGGPGGTVIFTNNTNNYAGGTTVIENTTLRVTSDGELGAAGGGITLGDASTNGTLDLSTSPGPFSTSRNFTLNTGGGTILTGPNGSVTLSGTIADGSTPGILNIGGSGSGTLVLSGSNSFSGGINLNTGTLSTSSGNNLGSGTVSLAGGTTLQFTGTSTYGNAAQLSGAASFSITGGQTVAYTGVIADGASSGTLNINAGTGTLILQNANSFTGGINLTSGTLSVSSDSNLGSDTGTVALSAGTTFAFTVGGGYNPPVTLSGDPTFNVAAGQAVTYNGVIADGTSAGTLTVTGGGTLVLDAANTYTGGTLVNGNSTLQVGADSNLGGNPTGTVTLSTGTLILTGTASSQRTIALGAGGGTIDTSGGTWTFTNAIGGANPLTVGGSGVLALDAVNTYSGGTTITGGTLQVGDANSPGASVTGAVSITGGTLAGYGTVIGNVTNSGGTVAPGGSGTLGPLTITGNYTPTSGGTTSFAISQAGTSQLMVGGVATLTGSTLVTSFSGNFHTETIQLMKAGTLTGTFASWNANTLSIAIGESLSYNTTTGVLDLILTQDPLPTNDTPTIYPAITSVAINEAQSASDTILARLTELRTEPAVDDMPMADSTTHRPGHSDGRSPYGAWFKALGGFGSTTGGGSAPGYGMDGGGFVLGLDLPIGESAVAGVAIGYNITAISENGGASADIDTPRALLYGGWWHGPIALDGTVGLGYASLDSTRPISGTGTTASASFSGTSLTGAFQASSPMHFGPIAFTPALGVEYARLAQDSIAEGGAGLYDLSVAGDTTNSLRPFVAATIATRIPFGLRNGAIEPQLRIAYAEEVLSTSRQALVQAPGDVQIFAVPGVTPAAGMLSADLGLKIETSRNFAFFTNVNVTQTDNSHSFGADAGIRYRF